MKWQSLWVINATNSVQIDWNVRDYYEVPRDIFEMFILYEYTLTLISE